MKRLYVRPMFRGEKLGKALVEHVIELARRLGYPVCVSTPTLPRCNQPSELYRLFGFEEVYDNPGPQIEGLAYFELRI